MKKHLPYLALLLMLGLGASALYWDHVIKSNLPPHEDFDNTDSTAIYLGGSGAGTYHAGTITNIAGYNVALTDAQIRGLSRFLGVQSNTGIA